MSDLKGFFVCFFNRKNQQTKEVNSAKQTRDTMTQTRIANCNSIWYASKYRVYKLHHRYPFEKYLVDVFYPEAPKENFVSHSERRQNVEFRFRFGEERKSLNEMGR